MDDDAGTAGRADKLKPVKRLSVLLMLAAAAGVAAALLGRNSKSEPPESWSPVEPS